MNPNGTYYHDLITRYLSGEASADEITELSVWIQADPDHEVLFDDFRKTWQGVVTDQIEQQLDLDREWEALRPKLTGFRAQGKGTMDDRRGTKDRLTEIRRPASGNVTARNGVTKQQHPGSRIPDPGSRIHSDEPEQEPKTVQMDPGPLSWQVVLIRASLVAAIALVLLVPTWIVYRYFTQSKMIMITASEKILETTLPDGSRVTLNAFATLSYPEKFGKENRDVSLQGDGYFEVGNDSLRPFIISCNNSRVEVLGTSFYVDASRQDRSVDVILLEGSVTVYFDEARSTGKTIIPGEKARLTETDQRIVVTQNEDPNFMAWKSLHMIFLDDPLDMVIRTLNKIYQADIVLASENLATCRLTASFDQQSLESVLNVIMATLDLRSETTSSGIVLYGKGCN